EGQTFIDATVNGGGHARAIAEYISPAGKVIGIDWDCDLIRESGIKNQELGITNITLVCDTYVNIKAIAENQGVRTVDGILFDLGFSSHHLERSERGFSFLRDEPLDMRYNSEDNQLIAERIVNTWQEEEITKILWEYGEERWARRIARGIAEARAKKKIVSSKELADIIVRSIPRHASNRIHPATRTFQALRIAVNSELESLERVLPLAWELLVPGGRLVVISFHSLEDRMVKIFFKEQEKQGTVRMLTKKPIRASYEEIRVNPRSRSARLRGATKI
ncbi:MAG: 16S rRNA (cytosine(1402)-N(4))-methyltransferase RsmH, partial [Candidatus Sungiibacteriota bacterium]